MAVSAMSAIPALKEAQQFVKSRMEKAVNDFRSNLASTRTGRANVQMLDQVRALYYGAETPLNQLAQLSTPDAQTIVIQPFDPSAIAEIEKALRLADSSYNPQNDGKLIRLKMPAMNEERRLQVVKQLNRELEEHRTGIRNVRRDGNEMIKKAAKDKLISVDEEKRSLEEVQKLTDEEIKRMEELCKAKEKEVMQV
jgi:ribosome recycling factor